MHKSSFEPPPGSQHQIPDEPPPAYSESSSTARPPPFSRGNPPMQDGLQLPEKRAGLQKPIVIPATAAVLGSPFLRAYPPCLEAFGLGRAEFLNVLDGLNRVAVQSPPLRALGLVGEVLEIVPVATAQTVGLAINLASTAGKIALSKGATEIYLRKVNEEVFAPRGLKMEIAKLDAVARINKLPILDAKGKVRDDARLLQPLLDLEQIQTMGVAERWLQALEYWVEPLEVDVEGEPLPAVNTEEVNLWGKIHAFASERERQNIEKKRLKDRGKTVEKHDKRIEKAEEKREKVLAKLDKKEQKVGEHGNKGDDKIRKLDLKREKVETRYSDRVEKATERSVTKDKEAKAMTKVLWITIRNLREDSGSGGAMDIYH
ncbi:hypothetical protein F4808DRAFT_381409 [Astrocystis sublimbata]|nr:hypothetical protein F4808DRAFT_381409 [Astrocystis sublimbata]